jgi:hypothetical protein
MHTFAQLHRVYCFFCTYLWFANTVLIHTRTATEGQNIPRIGIVCLKGYFFLPPKPGIKLNACLKIYAYNIGCYRTNFGLLKRM